MKRPTSNDFVLLFRTYWERYDEAIQSYCQDLEDQLKAERASVDELSLHCQELEARLKGEAASIDPVVRSLRHAEEIIAQGPNGLAWPDISPHQIKAEVKP